MGKSRLGLRHFGSLAVLPVLGLLGGCTTSQSVLFAVGEEAAKVNLLFWAMTVFLGAVFVGTSVLAAYAISGNLRVRSWLARERFILNAGLIFPAVGVTLVLVYGLMVMVSRASAEGDPRAVRAAISGEQWWWRVAYALPDGRRIDSANELRIPVGAPVVLELTSPDVIHSFWVPNLAGKLDMIPGRTNVLTLTATEAGISRGQCAEYCGGAHAFMAFYVIALEGAEYDEWLAHEASDAVRSDSEGAALFEELGCGSCHAIRGTSATGVVGPDLTHVGSRMSLAAAALPNDAEAFARWIRDNQHIKPGNRMPPYETLGDEELALLANYLEGLK